MRNSRHLDVNLLYTYAAANGFTGSLDQFVYCVHITDWNQELPVLDKKFNLTALYDKQDNFIKVIE